MGLLHRANEDAPADSERNNFLAGLGSHSHNLGSLLGRQFGVVREHAPEVSLKLDACGRAAQIVKSFV